MRRIDKDKLDSEQVEIFDIICKEQKKNIYDVLDNFIKQYNIKYNNIFEKAINEFFSDEKD